MHERPGGSMSIEERFANRGATTHGCDFDRLMHHANHDTLVRQFLGHADFINLYEYKHQTLAVNIRHLTPELTENRNQVVHCPEVDYALHCESVGRSQLLN